MRQSFHEFAGCSIQFRPWAAKFYRAKCSSGCKHNVAVQALAFKRIRIIYACWRDHIPYHASNRHHVF